MVSRRLPLLGLMSALACAAEPAAAPLWDLRVGVGATPSPSVEETVKTVAAPVSTTTINWGDEDGRGRRIHLGLWRLTPADDGFLWGVETAFASHSLGLNPGFQATIGYRQLGAAVLAGWQWGLTNTPGLRGHVEVTPLVGAGTSWLTKGDERAFYYEYGLRTGAFLDERSWTAGVTLGYVRGFSTIRVDRGATVNTLDLTTSGFRFGLEAGYRF